MACIETVDFGRQGKFVQVNISDIVGVGEKNEKSDVMLIQTLFKFVGWSDTNSRAKFGLAMKDLPEPTGIFDAKTTRAIWSFQQKMRHRLRNIDGKIHPASYTNRVLRKGMAAPQMMITLLNIEALDGALMLVSKDLINAVKEVSPTIIFC